MSAKSFSKPQSDTPYAFSPMKPEDEAKADGGVVKGMSGNECTKFGKHYDSHEEWRTALNVRISP